MLLGRGLPPGDPCALQGSLVDRALHWGVVPGLTFQFTHWGQSLDYFLSLNSLGLLRFKKVPTEACLATDIDGKDVKIPAGDKAI